MRLCYVSLLLFSAASCGVYASKILIVFPMPAYSHYAVGSRLAKELAVRGHEVTMISPYPQKTPIKNFRDISVADHVEFVENLKQELLTLGNQNMLDRFKWIVRMGEQLTERTYMHENVQGLLKSGETFDLAIIEYVFDEALVGLATLFNVPYIWMSTGSANICQQYVANPAPPSYVPSFGLPKRMTFLQRLKNLMIDTVGAVLREIYLIPPHREIFKKYTRSQLELDDVLYNASLLLANSHISINDAVPRVPSIVDIGGFHIYPPKKLPEHLQDFLDSATEGVVLFSMGSNLKSKDLSLEVRSAFLNAFSQIKMQVLWKFEIDLPDVPPNVKIMQWVPQQDVLAHPNVKVFISHGGILSTIEAVYSGVPIVGVPVYGDQKSNIAAAVESGYAVNLSLEEISEEKLTEALNEIVHNPKYRANVQQRSRLMNDRPVEPIDEAVYWVEHVLRHNGAPHLRTAGLDLNWYQRNMLDIIVVLTLTTILLFIIFYIIIKKILGICSRKKVKTGKLKKN